MIDLEGCCRRSIGGRLLSSWEVKRDGRSPIRPAVDLRPRAEALEWLFDDARQVCLAVGWPAMKARGTDSSTVGAERRSSVKSDGRA